MKEMEFEPSLPGLKVLVVEDDKEFAASMQTGLEDEGCAVNLCFDGGTGLRQAEMHAYDILLLDVMLPVLDGFEVTKRLRLQGVRVPIVLLTGLDATKDVVQGLNAGADDYLTKPFDFEVLIARIQARMRFLMGSNQEKLRFADLTLDTTRCVAIRAGQTLDLTRTEFAILECLMRSAGRVARRERIIEYVWPDQDISRDNLDTFIRFLRHKVDLPNMPRLIHTKRGIGYTLQELF